MLSHKIDWFLKNLQIKIFYNPQKMSYENSYYINDLLKKYNFDKTVYTSLNLKATAVARNCTLK